MNLILQAAYFSKNEERFLSFLAVACFLAVALESFSFFTIGSGQPVGISIAKIIFLNHVHVFFTPLLLLSTGSGRKWVKEANQKEKFWIQAVVVLCVVCFVFENPWQNKVVNMAFFTIIAGWGIFHNVRQAWGMSSIYRELCHEIEPKFRKWEKVIFHSMVWILVISFSLPKMSLGGALTEVRPFLFWISLGCVFAYVLSPVIRGKKFFSLARAYDLRLFFYPFALTTFSGLFAILSLHGIEYLFLTRKFFKFEKDRGVLFGGAFTLIVVLSLVLVSAAGPTRVLAISLGVAPALFKSFFFSSLKSLSVTASLFHYLTDQKLFTRKNASSARWILPGLKPDLTGSAGGIAVLTPRVALEERVHKNA